MKTSNKLFAATVLALFTLLFGFGCADVSVAPHVDIDGSVIPGDNKVKAHENFSRTVSLENQTSLKVEGINGSISINSVEGTNQVTVTGDKVVSADTYHDAASRLNDITIKVDELTNELLVKTLQPKSSNGRSYQVNYTITVPSHLNVVVDNVNGEINGKLSVPQNGTVDLSLQNGTIKLDIPQNTSADFSASLVNGIISVQNLTLHNRVATSKSLQGTLGAGQGTISLRTTNGNIDVLGY